MTGFVGDAESRLLPEEKQTDQAEAESSDMSVV
jgi:hypothetical protein